MIIYNVTTKVHHSIAAQWLQWLQEEHIPEIIQTGCFTKTAVMKIMEVDETEGPTYAVQYFAESKANYNLYIEKYATELRKKTIDKWGDKFIAFRTLMQVIN